MKSEFLHPRFDDARFAEHTLPLEVARDLAAYETLVVALAKYLYSQEHSERVDDGSAKPRLSIVTADAVALGAGANLYFERARFDPRMCGGSGRRASSGIPTRLTGAL